MPLSNTELVSKIDRVITGHQEFVDQQVNWLTSTEPTVTLSDPYAPSTTITVKTPYGMQAEFDALIGPTGSALAEVQATVDEAEALLAAAGTHATASENAALAAATSAELAGVERLSAQTSATAAASSATEAENAWIAIQGFDSTAEASATAASTSATAAATSATDAAASATAAADSADAAAASEAGVAASATAASTSATNAATSATTASTAATNAAASATTASIAASTATDKALEAEEFRDETSDLHDATAAIAADIGDAITAARASTALSLSGSASPFVKRELMMDFNEEENALPLLGDGPSYFWVNTGPRFAYATNAWDSDKFFGMMNMQLYSETGSTSAPDSRWVYCPEELGYKPTAQYSSITSMFRFAVDYEFDQEMLQKTTLYFGLNCGLEENNLFNPANSSGAWVQFEPAQIGGVWKYRVRIVARGAGASQSNLLDDTLAIPMDANVRTYQLSLSTTGSANQQLVSLQLPTATGATSQSMFITGVSGFPLDLALRPFTGMTRTAALNSGNETSAIVISDYFYVSSGTDNRAQIGPVANNPGEFDFDGSRFLVTVPDVYGYAFFDWHAQGATPGNGELMLGTNNDGDVPQARMLFEDGDGRVTTLAQNVTFTPDYDGPGSGTMTIEHGTLAAAGTDATFDSVTGKFVNGSSTTGIQAQFNGWSYAGSNVYNGQIMVGAAPYGMRLAATPSANGDVDITNMLDTTSSNVKVKLRGMGTPVTAATFTVNGINGVLGFDNPANAYFTTMQAATGSFANFNTTNDNSATMLLGRYSAAFPSAYHTLRAGTLDYRWQTSDGVDRMFLNDTGLTLIGPTAPQIDFASTGNGTSVNARINVENDGSTTNTGEIIFSTRNPVGTLAEHMRIAASGVTTFTRGAQAIVCEFKGGTQSGYVYSGNTHAWFSGEPEVWNAWGVNKGTGVLGTGEIQAWAGGSMAMQVTATTAYIARPTVTTGAVLANKQAIGAFSVPPRAGSPSHFVVKTKIPYTDGRAPVVNIKGFNYAHSNKVVDCSIMWYAYTGTFYMNQINGVPGTYVPNVRLDKYNDGVSDYVRIEIDNASTYWSHWHFEVVDTFGVLADYMGWSVVDGQFGATDTGGATTAALVTVNKSPSFHVSNTGDITFFNSTVGGMRTITVGAADSGGTGYRMLRIAN
jgi:hypothetical protein